jgi:hypothetical protein
MDSAPLLHSLCRPKTRPAACRVRWAPSRCTVISHICDIDAGMAHTPSTSLPCIGPYVLGQEVRDAAEEEEADQHDVREPTRERGDDGVDARLDAHELCSTAGRVPQDVRGSRHTMKACRRDAWRLAPDRCGGARTSHSNCRRAPPGISPAPLSPYPRSAGIESRRLPPTRMPAMPSSQPGMTRPWPRLNAIGARPTLESNSLPLSSSHPVYCTLTTSPAFASSPEPGARLMYCRPEALLVQSSSTGTGPAIMQVELERRCDTRRLVCRIGARKASHACSASRSNRDGSIGG